VSGRALLIGNSDGIGLTATKALLGRGWKAVGVSRSETPINDSSYEHFVIDVQDEDFMTRLNSILVMEPVDLCVYFAGIGELLDFAKMEFDLEVFDVNLIGMVKTATCVIPSMIKNRQGHFIGISSVADEMLSPDAPSYHASKAGFSNYLEGLALALKPSGIHVTNIRFGFVDTKMAKGDLKPFMMSVDRSVQHLLVCIDKKPIRYTAPWIIIPLVNFRRYILRLITMFK